MRILVAGSSGFLGSALVPALREAGHDVRRLVRRAPSAADEHEWDPPAGTIADGAFDGVDAVVNLCGSALIGRWTEAFKQAMKDSRIEPTEVLAEAVSRHGVGLLVNASAIGFYGDTGDTTVDESAGQGGGFLAELVYEWEQATAPAAAAGARVVMLRSGIVLGDGGMLFKVLKPLFQLGLGGRAGSGRQWMPWISLPDHVSAARFLIERDDVSGPVNMCSPNPVTNAEFTKAFARALHRPAPWVAPKFALQAVLGAAAQEVAFSGQHALPKVLTDAGFRFRHRDIGQALADVV